MDLNDRLAVIHSEVQVAMAMVNAALTRRHLSRSTLLYVAQTLEADAKELRRLLDTV